MTEFPGQVVIVTADEQTQGRGRLQREWVSSMGAGIALSIGAPVSTFVMEPTLIPLAVGVAVIRALNETGITAALKWPNDIVFSGEDGAVRKTGGILLQLIANQVVIGIGINVDLTESELPTESATSLLLEGYKVKRELLIAAIISNLQNLVIEDSDAWRSEYESVCATISRSIRVTLADGSHIEGVAKQLSVAGGLLVDVAGTIDEVTVGDIEHIRHI